MGRWLKELSDSSQGEVSPKAIAGVLTEPTKAISDKYIPVEKISLVEGWQQIITESWQGVGLLEVLPEQQSVWGAHVLIAEHGVDRAALQAQYPKVMIFEPNEFRAAVKAWPDNESVIQCKRAFNGQVFEIGGAA